MTEADHTAVDPRVARWRQFMNEPDPPRHLFIIHCPMDHVPQREMRFLWPEHQDDWIEWICRDYEGQIERLAWLHDDHVPNACLATGTEIFAEAFGCSVVRDPDNMPFAQPIVHEAGDVAKIIPPRLGSCSLDRCFDAADAVRRRLGDDVLLRLPDVQSPMDVAALIWNKNDLFTAMIETPDEVKQLAGMTCDLMIAFFDDWFARYGRRYVAHYPAYCMEGGLTLSEDEIGAVSPAMFDEFFLPHLARLSEHFGGLGIHCCANARHQWNGFREVPNLRLINLVQPAEVTREAYEFFAGACPQMHNWTGEGEPWDRPATYPGEAKVIMELHAETAEQARKWAAKLPEACKR